MGWRSIGKDVEPDGKPFTDPVDAFERAYNAYLERQGEPPESQLGFPIPTRVMDREPENSHATRNLLDWCFDPYTQRMALEDGNTHEELDQIASGVLKWAVRWHTPITDGERNVAKRLGIDVSMLGRHVVTRGTLHRLGI